jgi:hypothetical protein
VVATIEENTVLVNVVLLWMNHWQSCYGKAGSSKLFDMVNDILQTPGQRMTGGWSGAWGNGQFGTGPCGEYCLCWGLRVYPDWEQVGTPAGRRQDFASFGYRSSPSRNTLEREPSCGRPRSIR